MGDLTKNISRYELACNCGCGFNSMDWETINKVQEVCHWAETVLRLERVSLNINSACRCEDYNNSIGSNNLSQHIKARAMDINIVGIHPSMLYEYFAGMYVGKYGIGKYDNFVHFDTRDTGPARW